MPRKITQRLLTLRTLKSRPPTGALLQTAASERRQHLHDALKLDFDGFGRDPCGGQILAEPTLQGGTIYVAGLFEFHGGRVQVVTRQLADAPITQAGHPCFFWTR